MNTPENKNAICDHCKWAGHTAENCTNTPPPEQARHQIQEMIHARLVDWLNAETEIAVAGAASEAERKAIKGFRSLGLDNHTALTVSLANEIAARFEL